MSGTAKIYDAELSPTKDELARCFGAIRRLIGSYRFVDPAGETGIETLIGEDIDERLIQLPLTYSPENTHPEALLSEMEHSVLGKRYVMAATANEVSVREYIRVIVNGDEGAAFSDGSGPAVEVKGSGDMDAEVGEVVIREFTRQRALGTVVINGEIRSFFLRIPNLLMPSKEIAAGHTTSRLRLTGWKAGEPDVTRVLAELSWGDLSK